MKIVYTSHLEFRLKTRNIPYDLPRKIFRKTKEHYYDNLTRHYIAVYRVKFESKLREMALTYDREKGLVGIITIHPIKLYQKYTRINSGRWTKL